MPRNSTNSIIDILVSQNIIDLDKVNSARNESLSSQVPIEQVLIQKGWIRPNDITKAKSVMYGVPYIDVANVQVPQELLSISNQDEALRSKILIFEKNNSVYKAAMANPLDIQSIRFIEQKLDGRIQVYIALEEDLVQKIKNIFSTTIGTEVSSAIEQAVSSSEFIDISTGSDQDLKTLDLNSAPVAKIVNIMLESAVRDKASDIHIEPQEGRIRVRFRVNGILKETLTLPSAVGPSLVSRIKILGRMPIDEKRKPLDGRFQIKSENQEIDLRISSLPTVLGEKIVIRLLRKDLGILSLEDTGMRGNALKTFLEGLKATSGIILVTGPTGSGKTVTVATSMFMLNKPEVNVVSIEDPVEIKVPGVNQVQVNVDAGLTFAAALRSFLRQDPNIISVGEIRDQETAQLAAQASLTGHLVISTLHTNSAAGVLPRLLDMGIEPYIIASTVNICSAQRLCRRICPHCKIAFEPGEADLLEVTRVLGESSGFNLEKFSAYQINNVIKDTPIVQEEQPTQSIHPEIGSASTLLPQAAVNPARPKLYLFKGKGCDKCLGTGYSGRVGIFEVFRVTEKIGSLVMQHSSADIIEREAMNGGMIKMIQDGYFKCLDGQTTIDEVQRVIHA
jgi:type IV pilus assembly protein PilB